MNGRFLFILILLIIWFILGWFFFNKYLCGLSAAVPVGKANETTKVIAPVKKDNSMWHISDGQAFDRRTSPFYEFARSSFAPISGGTGFISTIDATSDYLKTHKDRSLIITGYYDSLEVNNSILPDLGLARANAIKKELMSKGVSGSQIDIASDYSTNEYYSLDTLRRGALFAFTGKTGDSSTRLNQIKSRLLGKPITIYFGTNQDNIALSSQQRTDFTDLIYYLDNVPGAKLDISGHTDNIGNYDVNVNLSQSRSQFVRSYLTTKGNIPNNRMVNQGFGPDKPVADNSTRAGRAKNRRVEVTLN